MLILSTSHKKDPICNEYLKWTASQFDSFPYYVFIFYFIIYYTKRKYRHFQLICWLFDLGCCQIENQLDAQDEENKHR